MSLLVVMSFFVNISPTFLPEALQYRHPKLFRCMYLEEHIRNLEGVKEKLEAHKFKLFRFLSLEEKSKGNFGGGGGCEIKNHMLKNIF